MPQGFGPQGRQGRGQALALFALTLLLLTLMVLMTISFGVNASRRADLNNAADAAAYASAVETARTFNTAALLNRAIIAHYVTMAGIEAQMAYVSDAHNMFNMAGLFFRMMDMSGAEVDLVDAFAGRFDGSGRCGGLTTEVRDASYEMWHAALFFTSPGGPAPAAWPGDNVNGYCQRGVCSVRRPFARGDGWLQEGLPELERRAAQELKAAHAAIHQLAGVQRQTYLSLHDSLRRGTVVKDIADTANLDSRLTVWGRDMAREELNASTQSTMAGGGQSRRDPGFEHGFASTILGTRPRERLQLQKGPDHKDQFSPMFKQLRDFANAAFAAYPGQPFRVTFTESDLLSDYTWLAQDNQLGDPKRIEEGAAGPRDLRPGMGYSYGRAQGGSVVVQYDDACAGRQTRTIRSGIERSGADPVTGQHYHTFPAGVMVRSSGQEGVHSSYASDHVDGIHWTAANGIGPMGCHGTHAHYGATEIDSVHKLDDDTLPPEVLTFVLADPSGDKGAHGLWGQPVLPVHLSRSFPLRGDPWALRFRFGFGGGADFDMQQANVLSASAAGVAHYHRRGHLGEPPNLLNPFWRATLQPLEVDSRPLRIDPTARTQVADRDLAMMQVLRTRGMSDARKAYDALRDEVHGMQRPPGDARTGEIR